MKNWDSSCSHLVTGSLTGSLSRKEQEGEVVACREEVGLHHGSGGRVGVEGVGEVV